MLLGYAALLAMLSQVASAPISGLSVRFAPEAFFAHLLLIHDWGFFSHLTWNVPAWSISAEFAAYLLFPCLLVLMQVRNAGPVRLALNVIVLWGILLAIFRPYGFDLGSGIQQIGALRCILEFAGGIVACEIYLRAGARVARLGPLLFAFAAAALAASIHLKIPTAFLIPAGSVSFVLALAVTGGRFRKVAAAAPWVYLGEVSYATYMCHYLVFDIFKLLCVKTEGEAPLWTLVATGMVILGLSPLLYHTVERPSQKWMAKRLAA
jgi:peptidoglycan/LPS O-acetylase OafA/YrhL